MAKSLIWRRIGAIVAGFLTGAVLSVGTDQVLRMVGVCPPWGQPMSDGLFGLAMAYRVVFNILGCYVAARLAPVKPLWHALFIGWLGLAIGILAAAGTWNKGPEFGPHWYSVIIALISLPCAWVGGKLGTGRGK